MDVERESLQPNRRYVGRARWTVLQIIAGRGSAMSRVTMKIKNAISGGMTFKAADALCVVIAGTVLACLMDYAAMACPGSSDHRTVFFDEVPPIIFDDAHGIFVAPPEVAVEIAITGMNKVSAVCPAGDLRCGYQVGVAEVNHVLKGQVGSRSIKIVAPAGDCDEQLQVGAKGIVVGHLRGNADGELELVLISESEVQQQLRKSAGTLHGKWWR
jgi:hypothetical protein